MKHALIVVSILAPWIVGLLAIGHFTGWNVLRRGDIRTQADQLRAFGSR